MSKPSLLILSFSPIASDARVLKQIELFRDGWDVTTCGYGPAPDGVSEHIVIPDELAVWRYPRLLVVLRQYRRAYWQNAAIRHVRASLRGRAFDAALANDVDTAGIALEVASAVHSDLHEYAPSQHENLLRARIFVRPFVEWMCRRFVAAANSWTTVSGGLAREYERRFGFAPELVVNAAPFSSGGPSEVHEPIRLVHSGACLRARNIHLMIEAAQASTTGATLDLYLTPNDPDYLRELKSLAARSPRTVVHDPVPYRELVPTLRGYDVGLFLLPPVTFNYRWALPNKLFDYVQARLGTLVGPSPEMSEFVRSHGLGVVTDDFTRSALTRAIDALDAEQVARFKAAADRSARDLSSERQSDGWAGALGALRPQEAS